MFNAEDAEATEFYFGIQDQAVNKFVEDGLNDLAAEVQGKVELGGDRFRQVIFDHGG